MHFDSLIFDMDGTLWDNVNSYVNAWNTALKRTGFDVQVSRGDLLGLMGKEINKMMDAIVPGTSEERKTELMYDVFDAYHELAETGQIFPTIYPDVLEGLEELAKKYKILLLSNCEEGGLVKFMKYTATTHLITGYMEYGQNFRPKSFNLQLLIDRHNLQSTVYIGDTAGDSRQTRMAGIPFVYVSYGFGETDDFDLKFDSFGELTDYFLKL